MSNKTSIKYCPFCGHWINNTAKKCNSCGEFMVKRWWFSSPPWISAFASFLAAVGVVIGAWNVKDILKEGRVKAIENHLTWIEVRPVDFKSTGNKDSADPTSTFWYIEIQVENLGKETGLVRLKNWSFASQKRGKITEKDYNPKELEFSLSPSKRVKVFFTFVMNSDYHIPLITKGEDVLTIEARFNAKDMSNTEICEYKALWGYTRGKFSLIEDDRRYERGDKGY
ncbi:MAG: hypothetical protein AB1401_09590 [Thermodesulfobacteriota bacterium]